MITIKYFNQRRGSGKTTDLVNAFLVNPGESMLVALNTNSIRNNIKPHVDEKYWKRLITINSFPMCGYRVSRLLIDEYDFIKDKKAFTFNVLPMLTENAEILIKTTPVKTYKKQNLAIAQLLHFKNGFDISSYLNASDLLEVNELRQSFISFPNTKIFDSSLNNKKDLEFHSRTEITGEMFE